VRKDRQQETRHDSLDVAHIAFTALHAPARADLQDRIMGRSGATYLKAIGAAAVANAANSAAASKPGTVLTIDGNAIVETEIWPLRSAGKLIRIEDGMVNWPGAVGAAQTKLAPLADPAIRT